MMDSFLLLFVSLFLKQPTTCLRLLTASAAGSIYCCVHTVFTLWQKVNHPELTSGIPGALCTIVTTILSYLLLCMLMLHLAFGIHDKHSLMKNMAVFYAVAVFTGGVFQSAINLITQSHHLSAAYDRSQSLLGNKGLWASWGFMLAAATAAFFLGVGIVRAWHKSRTTAGNIYDIFLEFGSCRIHTKALLDTGNQLYDPPSRRPVTIVEQGVLGGLSLIDYKNSLRAVPFKSLGNEHGMIYAVKADAMIIRLDKKLWQYPEPLIGIYPGSLQKNGGYHGILHPDMVNGGQCM